MQGPATPAGGTGNVGDFFLNTTNGDVFEKTGASTWSNIGNIQGTDGLDGDRYSTTSTTSESIGTGAKSFTVETGLAYSAGQTALIAIDGSNFMEGTVTSYSGSTLNVNVITTTGAGSSSSWTINLNGAPGPAGEDAYIYVGYADDAAGTNFSTTSGTREYIGFVTSNTTLTPVVGDFSSFTQFRDLSANGDMLQATYDTNTNNIVDNAESAQSLSGTITTAQISDITNVGSGAIITGAERTNLSNQTGTNTGDEVLFNATTDGIVPAPGVSTGRVLQDDGTWVTAGSGDMLQATYDANSNNVVDDAESAQSLSGTITTAQITDITSVGSGAIITGAERANLSNQTGTNTGDEVLFSATTDGIVPAPGASTGRVLQDDGSWITPTTGATDLSGLSDANVDTGIADAQILIYDGATDNQFENISISGDIVINNAGVTAIQDDAVQLDDIQDNGSGQRALLANNNAGNVVWLEPANDSQVLGTNGAGDLTFIDQSDFATELQEAYDNGTTADITMSGGKDLRFTSSGAGEVFAIDEANERVGIGTHSPGAKLDVTGDIRSAGHLTTIAVGGEGGQITLGHAGNTTGVGEGNNTWNIDVVADNLRFFDVDGGGSGDVWMDIDPTNNIFYLGSANDDLEIVSPITFGGDPGTAGQVLQSNGAGVAPSWVAASGAGTLQSAYNGGQTIDLASAGSLDIRDNTGASTILTVDEANQRVGIGTNSPTNILDVSNNAGGSTVNVNSTGGATQNTGIISSATGTSSGSTGIAGNATGGTSAYGVRGNAIDGTITNVGVYGSAINNSNSAWVYGVAGINQGSTSATQSFGIYGETNQTGSTNNFGVYGTATGASGNNWAGYFEGATAITGELAVGSSPSPGTPGQVLQSNGAGAAPSWVAASGGGSLQGAYDGGPSILLDGTNEIDISTSGGTPLFATDDANQRLGIGTVSPNYFTEIVAPDFGNTNQVLRLSTTNTNSFVDLTGSATGAAGFRIRSQGGSNELIFQTAGNNDRMVINAAGNVGIDAPGDSKLQVGTGNIQIDLEHSLLAIDPADVFTYQSKDVPQYGTGWYDDAETPGLAQNWHSSFAGIKMFTSGLRRFSISQNGNVSIGTTSPATNAALDIQSNTSGLLIPRLTTAERNAIAGPETGLMIYNTSTNGFNFYDGGSWTGFGGGANTLGEAYLGSGAVQMTAAAGDIDIRTETTSQLAFFVEEATGNIGMGNNSPLAANRLTVSGGDVNIDQNQFYKIGNENVLGFNGSEVQSGSNLSVPLTFWAGGELARLTTSGNFGIGTNNPLSKLQLENTLNLYYDEAQGTDVITHNIYEAGTGDFRYNVTGGASALVLGENRMGIFNFVSGTGGTAIGSFSTRMNFTSEGLVINGDNPDASAVLDINSTTKGILIPRLTTVERDAIGSPATGLMVYNTTTNGFNYYNGGSWSSLSGGSSLWTDASPDIYFSTGNVGIGTTPSATSRLNVLASQSSGTAGTFTNNVSGVSGSALELVNQGTRSVGHNGVNIRNLTTKSGGSNSTKIGLNIESTGSWGPGTTNQPNVGLNVDVSGADNNYPAIFNGGYVGIGTNAPEHHLHIQDNVTASSTEGVFIDVQNTFGSSTSGATAGIRFKTSNFGVGEHYKGAILYRRTTTNGRGSIIFLNNDGDDNTSVDRDADVKMVIANDGNVGVGISTPSSKLDVLANTNIVTQAGRFINSTVNSETRALRLEASNGTNVSQGLWTQAEGSNTSMGVYARASNGSSQSIGVEADAWGAPLNYGFLADLNFATTGDSYAVFGNARGSGSTSSYGVYGTASNATTNYGVYGNASGGTTNWAGYFASGEVYVENNLGVGNTNPSYALDVSTTGSRAVNGIATLAGSVYSGYFDGTSTSAGNSFAIGVYGRAGNDNGTGAEYGVFGFADNGTSSGASYAVYASGDLAYTGSLVNASDLKLKRDIKTLRSSLSDLMKLRPTTYYYKFDEFDYMGLSRNHQIGLIAQEVEEIFPEVVTENLHPGDDKHEELEYKGIDYQKLTPVVIKAIQEQQEIIDAQKAEIEELKAQIAKLLGSEASTQAQLNELKAQMDKLTAILTAEANKGDD
ncbi:tail fiber domain-containing protein [Fulvivirga sp.]|uniref:tail fiber domain-containing protein n=1 Tax=Fulvivirga sp. TaxID=1931237 RepID=UPI0032ED7BA3